VTGHRPPGETQLLASVSNAARLLREFGRGEPQLGVSDLARRLGVAKSTAHRIVHTLAAEGLLERVADTGAYRLSVVMQTLGASAQSSSLLHGAATPVLDSLRNVTKETVQVAVLDGMEVVYVERRESPHTVRIFGGSASGHPRTAPPPARCCWPTCPRRRWRRGSPVPGWCGGRRTP
jgi:IclR family transcriptional regulator, KDG regulon repressor